MPISGLPAMEGDDIVTTGSFHSVNGLGGQDTLMVQYGSLDTDVSCRNMGYGWYRYTDDFHSTMDFYSFERFDVTTGSGDDYVVGAGLNDRFVTGAGNDTIWSGLGADTIDGGAGFDHWIGNYETLNINVSAVLKPAQFVTVLGTGARVRGIEQVDLTTGAGADVLDVRATNGNHRFYSNAGDDTFRVAGGRSTYQASDGVDLLHADFSSATTRVGMTNLGYGWWRIGDAANTMSVEFYGVEGVEYFGGAGNDTLSGGELNDLLSGGAGDDWLNGHRGFDTLIGGSGHDVWNMDLNAATVALTLTLTAAGDGTLLNNGTTVTGIESVQLITGAGNDVIDLSAVVGNHTLETNGGDDVVNLGRGQQNTVNGGAGTDALTFDGSLATSGLRTNNEGYGWWNVSANDGSYKTRFYGFEQLEMTGSNFNDRIYGQDGNDVIRGGVGRDILNGFVGNDTLHGGAGADFFEFSSPWSNGIDLVADAATGDLLRFNGARINSLEAGDGSTVLQWQAELQTVNGVTSLYLGLDGTAGYDFRVDLTGAFGADNFSVVSYSDFTGGADLIVL